MLCRGSREVTHTSVMYRSLARIGVAAWPLLQRDPRQRSAHRQRLAAPRQMAEWSAAHRERSRPLAWFHAASVGEGLQAKAVLEAFRLRRPECQLVFTHFSPSAEALAAGMPVDFGAYLPYDRASDIDAALDALSPDLLVFAKLDLWPELATRAAGRGVAVALVAATVLADSGRLRWPARTLLAPGYASLATIGAVGREDANRLITLGADPECITVTGDPRIDSVLERVDKMPPGDGLLPGDPAVTLVAGSTWPDDEKVLINAFAAVRQARPDARLVIVPHEPSTKHLAALDATIAAAALHPAVRRDALGSEKAPLVIVDQTGVLATLYRGAGMAYVGGGWGTAGIHSVLEPAAWGTSIFIGPHDRGSADARMLADAGALKRLPATDPESTLARWWLDLLGNPAQQRRDGDAARAALEVGRGAATRSAILLDRLLPDR
ncbi:MAG: glycosyltransferase N-terminal domain-containing protein [Gemmatimonadales bacterium]